MTTKVGIASDHAGTDLKQKVISSLQTSGIEFQDYGAAANSGSVDYPDFASALAKDISCGKLERGILICGTGLGMCIAANKHKKVRAVSVWDEVTAKMAKAHNDANIICLGARIINHDRALDYVKIWLDTKFEAGRHQGRIDKIAALERNS